MARAQRVGAPASEPFWPTVTPGASPLRPAMPQPPRACRVAQEIAVTPGGTACRFSSRRCAVTVTSSIR